MPTARISEVKATLAGFVNTEWSADFPARGVDDEVINKHRVDIDVATNTGRKIYVFDVSYTGGPIIRGDDQDDYTLMLWVVERYTGKGDPPEDWIEERKYFTEWLLKKFGNPRKARLLATPGDPTSGLYPYEAEVTTVYDFDRLVELKQFTSVITVTYRETRDPDAV